jgi:hypothetical protein
VGGYDPRAPARGEPSVKYHPFHALVLTLIPVKPGSEQCQLGSLTGAVSSILGRLNGNIENDLGCMLEPPFASRAFSVTNRGEVM